MHYGVQEVFVIDQGGEFGAEFIAMCEEFHIDTKVAGSHAPWQHGFAERYGGILEAIFEKFVYQFNITGKAEVKRALGISCQAKNAVLARSGMSPEQGVFGKRLRGAEFGTHGDEECPLAALGAEGEAWTTSQIRAAAKMAFLSRDVP